MRPRFDDYINGRISAFEAASPGVRVRWVDVPFDALDRKLIAAASAKRAPDLVNFSDMNFARFASFGALADLHDLLPGDPQAQYLDGALDVGRVGGGLRAVPWYLSTQVRMCNTSMLDDGGLSTRDLAGTWGELQQQAIGFHERTGQHLFSLPLGTESELPRMLLADGIAPFREEGDRLVADLTKPEVEAAIRPWVELYRAGALPREAATVGHAHLIELYQGRRLAMINTGANMLDRIKDVAPSVYDDTTVLSPATGSLGRAHIAIMPLAVMEQSKYKTEAARLAWFITNPESQNEFCSLVSILPSAKASLDEPFFTRPPTTQLGQLERTDLARYTAAEALRSAVGFTPAMESWPDLRRSFERHIKGVFLSDEDLATTLRRIEREWNDRLAEAAPVGADALPTMTALEVGDEP